MFRLADRPNNREGCLKPLKLRGAKILYLLHDAVNEVFELRGAGGQAGIDAVRESLARTRHPDDRGIQSAGQRQRREEFPHQTGRFAADGRPRSLGKASKQAFPHSHSFDDYWYLTMKKKIKTGHLMC